MGRAGGASFNVGTEGYAPALSYAHSRGVYAGLGLEGSVIVARNAVNFNFYGRELDPKDILRGLVPPPRAAQPLYDTLFHALSAGPAPIYNPKYSASMPVHLGESDSEASESFEREAERSDDVSDTLLSDSSARNTLRKRDVNIEAANVKMTRAAATPAKSVGEQPEKRVGQRQDDIGNGLEGHFNAALHTGGMFDIALS